MNILDRIGHWARERVPLWGAIERWIWQAPAPVAAVLTALGHGLATAITGPLAPVTATLYTVREIQSERKVHPSRKAPVYDAVSDVVVPWCVVALYAFLVGSWI